MRQDVTFTSEGAELAAWLYVPDSRPPWPVLVMVHGFSATRGMTADRYAEVFCAAGLAVLLYDQLGFGASGGEPRRHISRWVQARGYRDAISFASGLEGADAARIGLWGDSMSAGVALSPAAVDGRVAALAVQVPSIGATLPPPDPDGTLFRALRAAILAGEVRPSEDELLGPMPVVSDDEATRPSALEPLTAYRWFTEYGGRPGSNWVNEVTRVRLKAPVWHPGLCAPHISCPTLFVVSPQDEMPGSVPAVSRDAFEKLRGAKEWSEVDGGHFGLLYYPSEQFDRAAAAQVRFLSSWLLADERTHS